MEGVGPLPYVAMAAGEGTMIRNPVGGDVTFKVRAPETGGTMTVLETLVAPGDGPPLHVHSSEEEILYVLEGDVRFRLGEEERRLSPGGVVFVARGTPHCFQNAGTTPARMLVVFTPSGMERFFEAIAEAGRTDRAAFADAGGLAGMDVVGPPLGANRS
jgi:quercetin dioxygenase-like cupin family protein